MSPEQSTGNVVSFGKYKGRTVAEMLSDHAYCEWLVAQDWFQAKHLSLYNVVINAAPEPQDTPEHNSLQARFLDNGFCQAVLKAYGIKNKFAERKFERPAISGTGRGHIVGYVDVRIRFEGQIIWNGKFLDYLSLELKPSLGDDYPSIVRTARTKHCDAIIFEHLTTKEITIEQICQMFPDIKFISLAEIIAHSTHVPLPPHPSS